MKIGFCFDCKEDYGYLANDLSFCDFISPTAITFVKETLEKCGHKVILLGNHSHLLKFLKNGSSVDLVITAAEGMLSRNRESWVSSICEMCNIPYAGSDVHTLVVTLDKVLTKIIANYLNIPTPKFKEISSLDEINLLSFQYPAVIKPNYEGSSMGVKIVNNSDDLYEYAQMLFEKYAQKLILEEYISGKEITVSIIEKDGIPQILGMVESLQNNNDIMPIYSSEIKRIYGCKKIQPRISKSTESLLEKYSLAIYSYLKCCDYCRIDFRLDKDDKPYLLEVTPLPALSETASFMMAANLNKVAPTNVFDTIISNVCERYKLFPKTQST